MCRRIIRRLFVFLPVIVIIVMLIMIHRTIMDFIIIIFIKPLSVAIHETMYEQMLQQISRKGFSKPTFLHLRHGHLISLRLFCIMSSVAYLKYLFMTRSLIWPGAISIACT